jgi:hypothetical protein
MKEHGADTDTEPPNINGAERWMAEHSGAVDACQSLVPLPPWGLDRRIRNTGTTSTSG